jgi:hypothetical protein
MSPLPLVISAPQFDPIVVFGIGGIAVFMAIVCLFVYAKGSQQQFVRTALAIAVWMALTASLAISGVLARFDFTPPPMLVLMFSIFALSFLIGLSSYGRRVAITTSLTTLVGLQGFRLPLEMVMHYAATQGIMPVHLSYSGYNFDIITGGGAVLISALLARGKTVPLQLVWIWNIWGLFCLLVIAVIALLTSPLVHTFGTEPHNLNTWVLFFPYVWLPAVLVVIAFSGHLIIARKLVWQRQ